MENNLGTKECERKTNEKYSLYNQLDILVTLKSKRIGWTGNMWRAGGKMLNKITAWKPDRKYPGNIEITMAWLGLAESSTDRNKERIKNSER